MDPLQTDSFTPSSVGKNSGTRCRAHDSKNTTGRDQLGATTNVVMVPGSFSSWWFQTNPSQKYARQNWIMKPQGSRGWKFQKIFGTTTTQLCKDPGWTFQKIFELPPPSYGLWNTLPKFNVTHEKLPKPDRSCFVHQRFFGSPLFPPLFPKPLWQATLPRSSLLDLHGKRHRQVSAKHHLEMSASEVRMDEPCCIWGPDPF